MDLINFLYLLFIKMTLPISVNAACTPYPKGSMLYGIPCDKPVDSLDYALQLAKNLVFNFLLPAVGALFVIMFIFGGLQYITSAGDPKKAEFGKNTLTAAIIGLLIVITAEIGVALFAKGLGGGINP